MKLSNAFIFNTFGKLKCYYDMNVCCSYTNSNLKSRRKKTVHFSEYTLYLHILIIAKSLLSSLIWQSKITRIFIFLTISLLCLPQSLCHSECKFPEEWLGKWFQKGVPDLIHISKTNISEKGTCRKVNGEKYIVENSDSTGNCVKCLFISERHPNILQYKETQICYSKISFDICSNINGDAPLYSLFRVNTLPIKCPFKGPYSFSYSKGINECKDPLSEIEECTDDKRLLLKFKACADIYGSESRVEELECIADWKEGSYKYLVGKLHHNSATTDEDKFRCFVIEKNNSDPIESYNIGQSGDASCDGLFSPRDGLRTFKIRKTNEIQPKCEFPSWLSENRRWKTLDNRHIYDFSVSQKFTVYNTDKSDTERSSKCIESDDVSFLYKLNSSRFVIHTTFGCKSGFACMHAYLRDERIVEFQIGNIVSLVTDACSIHHFNPSTARYITLTTLDDATRECNLKGVYSIKSIVPHSTLDKYGHNRVFNYSRYVSFLDSRFICADKSLKLKSNCDDSDQFQFTCSIDNRVKNFKCRGGWKEKNTQMFLVSFIEKFNYEYCVNLNLETNEIKVVKNSHFCYRESRSTEPSANANFHIANKLNEETISYTLINEGSCSEQSAAISHFTGQCVYQWTICIVLLTLTLNHVL